MTGFFRDPEAWQTLAGKVIAPLVQERVAGSTIRVWVPGCSTGEEAYSIAMLVFEQAAAAGKSLDLKLFATDVAAGVLVSARGGIYPASIAQDVPRERLERWFDKEDDTYCVRRTLRETITFAPRNLLQDPPFSRLDLVSCRNLLIYLEPDVHKRLVNLFHFALREGGHLFLGPAETIGSEEDLFRSVSKKWRIFRRLGPTRHDIVDFPIIAVRDGGPGGDQRTDLEPAVRAGQVMDQALLERYAPASALIDIRCRVLFLRGPTEDYLRPPSGRALLRSAGDGARGSADRLARRGAHGGRRGARSHGSRPRAPRCDAASGADRGGTAQSGAPWRAQTAGRLLRARSGAGGAATPEIEEASSQGELQAELDTTREDLRLTVEQMETANEELKASNEEIRSINEELQASNEELETSKEELQSLNEELNTVNNQLEAKVAELEARTDDLNNLLNSTDIATLFLDRSLCIRWFTPSMKSLLELLATDIGRPISHFAQRFSGGDLLEEARGVLERLLPAEGEVLDDLGRCYIRRIVPYRTAADRIEGVVITFTEITERKRREREVQDAKDFAEAIVEAVRFPLIVLTPSLAVKSANPAFYEAFQVTRDETEGVPLSQLGNRQWDIPELLQLLAKVLPESREVAGFEIEHDFERIGRRTMLLDARPLHRARLILLGMVDLTGRKRAEAALADELQAMVRLHDLSTRVVRSTDLQTLLEGVLDATIELHGADFGNVQLYGPRDQDAAHRRPAWLRQALSRSLRPSGCRGRFGLRPRARPPSTDDDRGCRAGSRLRTEPRGGAGGRLPSRAVDPALDDLRRAAGHAFPPLSRAAPLRRARAQADRRLCPPGGRCDRRAVAPRIAASEERFRQFADNSRDVLWIVKPDMGGIEYLSPAYERIWGEPRDATIADLGHWSELVHPDDHERARQAMPSVLEGEPTTVEYRIVRPCDAEIRWIRDSGFPIRDERGQVRRAAGIARDVTEERRVGEERELLSRELRQSLAMQTDHSRSVEEFRDTFVGRLAALSRAHGMLLDAQWRGADLKELVEQALQAYRVEHPEVIEAQRESLPLAPHRGLALSLILHELATNAAKYGALSRAEGRVHVSWQVEERDDGRCVRLCWQERDGPQVEPPAEKSFGTRPIERASTYELGGAVELDYAPGGLRCELSFPFS